MFNSVTLLSMCGLFGAFVMLQLNNFSTDDSLQTPTSETNDKSNMVYCPGRGILANSETNLVLEFDTKQTKFSECYITPERIYNQKPYCLYVKAHYCTPKNVITFCYNTMKCAPGFTRISAVANRYINKYGKTIHSQAVCCR